MIAFEPTEEQELIASSALDLLREGGVTRIPVYDRDLDEIFEIQSQVALHIAEALETELSPALKDRIERRPTANLDAYHLYLEVRH